MNNGRGQPAAPVSPYQGEGDGLALMNETSPNRWRQLTPISAHISGAWVHGRSIWANMWSRAKLRGALAR